MSLSRWYRHLKVVNGDMTVLLDEPGAQEGDANAEEKRELKAAVHALGRELRRSLEAISLLEAEREDQARKQAQTLDAGVRARNALLAATQLKGKISDQQQEIVQLKELLVVKSDELERARVHFAEREARLQATVAKQAKRQSTEASVRQELEETQAALRRETQASERARAALDAREAADAARAAREADLRKALEAAHNDADTATRASASAQEALAREREAWMAERAEANARYDELHEHWRAIAASLQRQAARGTSALSQPMALTSDSASPGPPRTPSHLQAASRLVELEAALTLSRSEHRQTAASLVCARERLAELEAVIARGAPLAAAAVASDVRTATDEAVASDETRGDADAYDIAVTSNAGARRETTRVPQPHVYAENAQAERNRDSQAAELQARDRKSQADLRLRADAHVEPQLPGDQEATRAPLAASAQHRGDAQTELQLLRDRLHASLSLHAEKDELIATMQVALDALAAQLAALQAAAVTSATTAEAQTTQATRADTLQAALVDLWNALVSDQRAAGIAQTETALNCSVGSEPDDVDGAALAACILAHCQALREAVVQAREMQQAAESALRARATAWAAERGALTAELAGARSQVENRDRDARTAEAQCNSLRFAMGKDAEAGREARRALKRELAQAQAQSKAAESANARLASELNETTAAYRKLRERHATLRRQAAKPTSADEVEGARRRALGEVQIGAPLSRMILDYARSIYDQETAAATAEPRQ